MTSSIRATGVLGIGFLLLAACNPSNPCDDGYYEQRGYCYPEQDDEPAQDAAAGDAATADAAAADAGGTCDGSDPYAGMGNPCSDQEDCPCEANVCNTAFGYCSRLGCLEDDSVCPDDWSCLDISTFDPQAGSICVAP